MRVADEGETHQRRSPGLARIRMQRPGKPTSHRMLREGRTLSAAGLAIAGSQTDHCCHFTGGNPSSSALRPGRDLAD